MAPPQPQPPAPAPAVPDARPDPWGIVLDTAGIIAGIALVVIVIDVWTDGRLVSRRLARRPRGNEVPVERD
jgi:hypothetical protein